MPVLSDQPERMSAAAYRELLMNLVRREVKGRYSQSLFGIGWAIALGIPLGCWSAIRRDTWLDRVTGVLAVAAIAVPSFVVALYALLQIGRASCRERV